MTNNEKAEAIMKILGLSKVEFKTMTTPDKDDARLNKLFSLAQDKADEELDIQIRQRMTLSLS